MKRFRILGLCLIAALAMSVVASSSASAAGPPEGPEYGRCLKTAVKLTGEFTTNTCTVKDTDGNDGEYEWKAGPGPKPGFTNVATTTATLETVKGTKVTCTHEESTGAISSITEVEVPSVKFNGCKSSGLKCSTAGAGVEEIVTNALTGHLHFEKVGTETVDNELVPKSAPLFVEFECGGFKVEVKKEATGGLLNKLTVGKMLTTSVNTYTSTKGEQKPSEYEETVGVKTVSGLESNFAGGPFEEAGQTIKSTQTNEEADEVNNEV